MHCGLSDTGESCAGSSAPRPQRALMRDDLPAPDSPVMPASRRMLSEEVSSFRRREAAWGMSPDSKAVRRASSSSLAMRMVVSPGTTGNLEVAMVSSGSEGTGDGGGSQDGNPQRLCPGEGSPSHLLGLGGRERQTPGHGGSSLGTPQPSPQKSGAGALKSLKPRFTSCLCH